MTTSKSDFTTLYPIHFSRTYSVCTGTSIKTMDMEGGIIMAAENTTAAMTTQCVCVIISHTLEFFWTQMDPLNGQILTIITYVGCGVSSLCLGITILTYTAFEPFCGFFGSSSCSEKPLRFQSSAIPQDPWLEESLA